MEGTWYANKVGRNWGGAGLRDYLIRFEGQDPVMVSPIKIAKNEKVQLAKKIAILHQFYLI